MIINPPTKTGHYWVQPLDADNNPMGLAELVKVIFGYSYRRKIVTRVIAYFYNCNLIDLGSNVRWSDEVLPNFPKA